MKRVWLALPCLLTAGLLAGRAAAYSEPSLFSTPPSEGGGGGRWFTGSPSDGYTCAVCHSGGARTNLAIAGLPIDGYVPGASYEVVVDWPDAIVHVGLNAEITDETGRSAGTIQVPEGSTLDASEQCEPVGAGIPAMYLNNPSPERVVVNVADCGAKRLRFLWTAPVEPRGQLWLSGALVVADGMGTVQGDGVTDFARPITTGGGTPIASEVGGCSLSSRAGTRRHAGLWPIAVASLLMLLRRRARARRVTRSVAAATAAARAESAA